MSKNKGLGLVSALAVGAGVAAVAVGKKYKTAETKKKVPAGCDHGPHPGACPADRRGADRADLLYA